MKALSDFDLHDILAIFNKWKKPILTFIIGSTLLASLIVFILPQKYLATAICFPSNPVLADKSFIFNENIQNLYATYGSSPELDRLMSTAQLDTLYRFAVNEFDLRKRYKITEKGALGLKKTIKEFKEHYNVEKTVLGEMKIHTWDEDADKSAQMANALINKIATLLAHQNNSFNKKILAALHEEYELEQEAYRALIDSLQLNTSTQANEDIMNMRKAYYISNFSKFEKLINEYSVAVRANAPALLIQEYALAQAKPDKPKKLRIILMAFVLSCFFGVLLMFTLENRKA